MIDMGGTLKRLEEDKPLQNNPTQYQRMTFTRVCVSSNHLLLQTRVQRAIFVSLTEVPTQAFSLVLFACLFHFDVEMILY